MDDDEFRHYDAAQDDFSGFIDRLDLILGNFGRVDAVECMGRNHEDLRRLFRLDGPHAYILERCDIRKDLGTGNADRFVSRGGNVQGVFGIGLFLDGRVQAVFERRGCKFDGIRLTGRVGGQLLNGIFRDTGIGDLYGGIFYGAGIDLGSDRHLKPAVIGRILLHCFEKIHMENLTRMLL